MADRKWWQRAVIYQVYPRSFADRDGDGIGDLPGITAHLDYLAGLGVDAVWVSPVFRSPMADFGYDVSDYCAIDPVFGTLDDFDALVSAAHDRGLKLILDFVPNHTSDEHPWFVASRSSIANAKRDWYVWADPAPGGGLPNNWLARFGGSSWTLDAKTGQYYLHSFLPQQPDLNWRNPAVREAMYGVLRFWLERGVDGFRVDVLWLLIKDDKLRDDPPNPNYREGMPSNERVVAFYSADRPEVHEIVLQMRAVLREFDDDRLLIGEIYLPFDRLVTYYGTDLNGAQMPFNFSLVLTAWRADAIALAISEYTAALPAGAWPNYVLGNHDRSRLATRIGRDQARVAAMLLLTLRGTPTLYYGDELGMRDVAIPPDRIRDPAELREPGIGTGRDPERTPMPWDGSPGRGFTTATPWLPFDDDASLSVTALDEDPRSMLALYRALLALRRERATFIEGTLEDVKVDGDVLSYTRRTADDALLVVLNLGTSEQAFAIEAATIVISTTLERGGATVSESVLLAPNEGLVLALDRRPPPHAT